MSAGINGFYRWAINLNLWTYRKAFAPLLCLALIAALIANPCAFAANYTPAEQNIILGQPVMMDGATCLKKYGAAFCACTPLTGGGEGCFYRRPPVGPYSLAQCEQTWGPGQCACRGVDACYLKDKMNDATHAKQCEGTVYIFPGKQEECREAGIDTMGANCCDYQHSSSGECSFDAMAETLGWDSAAIMMVKTVGGYFAQQYVVSSLAEYAATQLIAQGALPFWASGPYSLFGDLSVEMMKGFADVALSAGGSIAEATSFVAGQIAAAIGNVISFVGYAYMIYQMYNMVKAMQECKPGEKILWCKVAKKACIFTGHKCTTRIFGVCLQKIERQCCYETSLARIIHEQGRPQLGMGQNDCRGFTLEEFSRLDFSRMDFSEYADDLTRQLLNEGQIVNKVQSIVDKYTQQMESMK